MHVEAGGLADAGDLGQRSITPAAVLPAVATTRNGRLPAARSRSIADRSASTSSVRSPATGIRCAAACPSPVIRAAFTNEWCASAET